MRVMLSEYGLLVISAIVVLAVCISLMQGTDTAKNILNLYDPYTDIENVNEAWNINQVTNLPENIIAPIISITNKYTELSTGEWNGITTFSSSLEVKEMFTPADLTINLGNSVLNRTDVINSNNYEMVIEVFELQETQKELTNKYGVPLKNELGEIIVENVYEYVNTGIFSDLDTTLPNLNNLTLNNNNSYKIIVTYRFTADNKLKAESQHTFHRKGAKTDIKNLTK